MCIDALSPTMQITDAFLPGLLWNSPMFFTANVLNALYGIENNHDIKDINYHDIR